jgi:Tfp pilus assembly protein FimT
MNKPFLMQADALIVSLVRVILMRPVLFLPQPCARGLAAQRGFSLIEISIVTTLMMLIAIIGIPAIQGYVIENKVPRVAEEMQRFVARMKANTNGFGASPYLGLDSGALANALRSSSVGSVTGFGPRASIAHGLGGAGHSGRGVISVEPQAVAGGSSGSAFSLTLNDVNQAACPALASILQRLADVVTIAGASGPIMVKNTLTEPHMPYNPMLADAQCVSGDRNTFVFTIR